MRHPYLLFVFRHEKQNMRCRIEAPPYSDRAGSQLIETQRIARPRFRVRILRYAESYQAGFCSCTLHPISDRNEPTLGRLWSFIRGVPPQPNYPSIAVPLKVSDMLTIRWCYIDAFPKPEDLGAVLPPTLCNHQHTTTTDCSKALWGLLVPLKDSGIFAGQLSSLGVRSRQWGCR